MAKRKVKIYPLKSDEELAEERKAYLREYYQTHKEKAKEYQKEYNRKRKAQYKRNVYNRDFSRTAKDFERPATTDAYTHSALQNAQVGGQFERALSRILSGEADLSICNKRKDGDS